MQRAYSLEKTLMLGKIESKRRRGRQRMRYLASITNSMAEQTPEDSEGQAWNAAVHAVTKSQTKIST